MKLNIIKLILVQLKLIQIHTKLSQIDFGIKNCIQFNLYYQGLLLQKNWTCTTKLNLAYFRSAYRVTHIYYFYLLKKWKIDLILRVARNDFSLPIGLPCLRCLWEVSLCRKISWQIWFYFLSFIYLFVQIQIPKHALISRWSKWY